ncbi:hypothetical protein VNO80_21939 [Phaseolus coccineus]|uniref:Uncharacterized protein n=1 Tax=Phaseolus coccineus TaxID=3886 RepID=A0AAN9M724_PHACN
MTLTNALFLHHNVSIFPRSNCPITLPDFLGLIETHIAQSIQLLPCPPIAHVHMKRAKVGFNKGEKKEEDTGH